MMIKMNGTPITKGFVETGGILSETKSTVDFLIRIGEEGLFQAIYGKSFLQVLLEFTADLLKEIYTFVILNGEVFFIFPAVIIMFLTFTIGKNKYTRFIIPLWFAYFVSTVLEITKCYPQL